MMEDLELPFIEERERMKRDAATRAGNGQRGPLTTNMDISQRVQTSSEFQATIRSDLENLSLCTVTATEMLGDSEEMPGDSGDSEESDGSSGSEGSEESEWHDFGGGELAEKILAKGEVGEGVEVPPCAFLLGDGEDIAAEWPSWLIGKGEQINHLQSWGQQT